MGTKSILLVQGVILVIIGAIIVISVMSPLPSREMFLNPLGQQLVDERCIIDGVPVMDFINGGLMAHPSPTTTNEDGGVACTFLAGSMVGVGKPGEREANTGQRLITCDANGEKPYFDNNYIDSTDVSKSKECVVRFKKGMTAEDAAKYNANVSNKRMGTDEANMNRLQSQLTAQEERNEILRREISRIDAEIGDMSANASVGGGSVTMTYRSEDTNFDGLPNMYAPGFAYVPNATFTRYITTYPYFKINGGPSLEVVQRFPASHHGKDVIKYGPTQQDFKSYSTHTWTFHS